MVTASGSCCYVEIDRWSRVGGNMQQEQIIWQRTVLKLCRELKLFGAVGP